MACCRLLLSFVAGGLNCRHRHELSQRHYSSKWACYNLVKILRPLLKWKRDEKAIGALSRGGDQDSAIENVRRVGMASSSRNRAGRF